LTHFAFITVPYFSHIRAMEVVADVLLTRGHRVTFVHQPRLRDLLLQTSIAFEPLDGALPMSSIGRADARRRNDDPSDTIEFVHELATTTQYLCHHLPQSLTKIGAEFLVVDQMEAAGALVAAALRLPYVSILSAFPINREPDVPPPIVDWPYDPSPEGRRRNLRAERVDTYLMAELSQTILHQAGRLGVPKRERLADCLSPFAQVSQIVPQLDFPRRDLPLHHHHVGPLRGAAEPSPLPLTIETGKPIIFASLGTLQGWRFDCFRAIAIACDELGVQSAVAHCGMLSVAEAGSVGAKFITDFLPQEAMLRNSSVAVTHAGLNTVLDALVAGCPLLAIPFAFDQPAIAARIAHAGVGLYLRPAAADAASIKDALSRLLSEPHFSERARAIGAILSAAGGAGRAADIIEAVAMTGKPVTACSRVDGG
jgi:zeaxanthin glucosyltransferase